MSSQADEDRLRGFVAGFLAEERAKDALAEAKETKLANTFNSDLLPAVVQVGGQTVIILHSPDMGQPRPVLIAKTVIT